MFQKSKRKIGSDSEDEGDPELQKGSDKEDEVEKPDGEGAEEGAEGPSVLPNVSDDDSDTDKPSSNR